MPQRSPILRNSASEISASVRIAWDVAGVLCHRGPEHPHARGYPWISTRQARLDQPIDLILLVGEHGDDWSHKKQHRIVRHADFLESTGEIA